jgi:hypothetical protein
MSEDLGHSLAAPIAVSDYMILMTTPAPGGAIEKRWGATGEARAHRLRDALQKSNPKSYVVDYEIGAPAPVVHAQYVPCPNGCGAILHGLLDVCGNPACLHQDIVDTIAYERWCDA